MLTPELLQETRNTWSDTPWIIEMVDEIERHRTVFEEMEDWLDGKTRESDEKAGERNRYWAIDDHRILEYRSKHDGMWEAFQLVSKKLEDLLKKQSSEVD